MDGQVIINVVHPQIWPLFERLARGYCDGEMMNRNLLHLHVTAYWTKHHQCELFQLHLAPYITSMFRMVPELPSFLVSIYLGIYIIVLIIGLNIQQYIYLFLTSNETASFAGRLETIPNIGASVELDFSKRVNNRFAVRGSK